MTSAFTVRTESDLSLLTHVRNGCSSRTGLLVLTSYPPVAGLISLVKAWRRDSTRNHIHVIMANENYEENMHSDDFLDVNLAFNVLDDVSKLNLFTVYRLYDGIKSLHEYERLLYFRGYGEVNIICL